MLGQEQGGDMVGTSLEDLEAERDRLWRQVREKGNSNEAERKKIGEIETRIREYREAMRG